MDSIYRAPNPTRRTFGGRTREEAIAYMQSWCKSHKLPIPEYRVYDKGWTCEIEMVEAETEPEQAPR